VDQQIERISQANSRIDELNQRKFELEAQRRALEAEVGPIKYIAEMVYGSSDRDLLEQAVRWLILLLVVVFDPLAVILTLAAITGISGFRRHNNNNDAHLPTVERIVEVEKPVEVERIVEVEDTEKVNELAQEVEALLSTIDQQARQIEHLKSIQTVKNQPAAEADFTLGDVSGASFGSSWPINPAKGQLFLKIDTVPNKLYKWNSRKWIEVDIARVNDTLAYDFEYIKWLITEVKAGRREYEDLSDIEQDQIKSYIKENGNNEDTR